MCINVHHKVQVIYLQFIWTKNGYTEIHTGSQGTQKNDITCFCNSISQCVTKFSFLRFLTSALCCPFSFTLQSMEANFQAIAIKKTQKQFKEKLKYIFYPENYALLKCRFFFNIATIVLLFKNEVLMLQDTRHLPPKMFWPLFFIVCYIARANAIT